MIRGTGSRPLLAGLDLGATKILSLIADSEGKVLGEDIRPTLGSGGPDAVIARMVESLKAAVAAAGASLDDVHTVGVSAPGPVDYASGVVTNPPNLPGWRDVPLTDILQRQLDARCLMENDANAAAVAEHRWGAGRGCRHMLFLTLSSGVGGGIIIDGVLYRGASGSAGEMGHMTVDSRGPACSCGRRGCLEACASGLAIARRAEEAAAKAPGSPLARIAAEDPPLTAKKVHRAASEGDPASRRIIARAGRYLGIGIGSLINIFNPQVIVLGGGLTKMGDLYLGPMRQTVREECFPQPFEDVRITVGEFVDEAPALGAAALAAQEP
jgi:glucokinase